MDTHVAVRRWIEGWTRGWSTHDPEPEPIAMPGREQTVGGVSVIRFAPDGQVAEQRDYWAIGDSRRDPPLGWL